MPFPSRPLPRMGQVYTCPDAQGEDSTAEISLQQEAPDSTGDFKDL